MFRPTREFFTHLETSPLSVKGCKFWPMLGNFGNWAVSCFFIVPHLLWHRTPENSWHSYQMPGVWQWSCHYLSWLVFELPTFHLRGVANGLIYCAAAAGRTLGSYTQFAVCFLSYIELYHLSHITNAKNVLYFEQLFSNVEFILRATMP